MRQSIQLTKYIYNKVFSAKKSLSILILFLFCSFSFSSHAYIIPCLDLFEVSLISTDATQVTPSLGGCGEPTPLIPLIPAWIQVPASDEDGTFSVTWALASNALNYKLERKLSSAASYTFISKTTSTSFTTNSLADGTYTFRVQACNSNDICSGFRASNEVVVNRPSPPPIDPGNVTRDLISDAIGSISGEFRVDEGGQANYTIPIFTPTGIAGISPTVSLSYNSGGSNGVMGVGWQMSVTSGIARCGKSIAVDGVHGSVNLDLEDRFCLGGQRLVLVSSGTYGSAGTEYRTVIDSQTKVIAYGTEGNGPQYFKVWFKDGSINYFGSTNNSQFHANNNGTILSTVLTWAHTYSKDRYGNRINYYYELDEANGENRIDYVEYNPNVKIQFNFTNNRSDYHLGYYAGGKTQRKDRLDSIVVTDENIEVRKYDFDYEISDSLQSRLTTITESKDGIEKKPLRFTWSNAAKGIQKDLTPSNGDKFTAGTFINFNDDLEPDWLGLGTKGASTDVSIYTFNGERYVAQCTRTFNRDVYKNANYAVFDLDGDGRDEAIVAAKPGVGATYGDIYALFFNDNGCLTTHKHLTNIGGDIQKWFFGDINGDGLPDLAYEKDNKLKLRFYHEKDVNLNDIGIDFTLRKYFTDEINANYIVNSFGQGAGTNTFSVGTKSFIDINQDGRLDLFVKVTNTVTIDDYSCDGPIYEITQAWIAFNVADDGTLTEIVNAGDLGAGVVKDTDVKFVDINMDGMSDLVFKNFADTTWHYRLFTGTKFLTSKTLHKHKDYPIYFGDHDQDGLMETFTISGNRIQQREFNRNGYLPYTLTNTGIHADNGYILAQIDINADGELDIVSVQPDEHIDHTSYDNWASFNKNPFTARDKITVINNGLGSLTLISYRGLTDPNQPDIYTGEKNWRYDDDGKVVYSAKVPQFVVQKVESSSPAESNLYNLNGIEYRYGQIKSHSVYGSLGFQWLETIDLQTDMITRTTYKQEYPYIGRPEKTQVWYENRNADRLISEAISEYSFNNVDTYVDENNVTQDIIFPYLSKSIENSFDFNLTTLSQGEQVSQKIATTEYNNYGDPKLQNAYTCYGHSLNCDSGGWLKRMRTVNTYLPANLSSWILGRLERAVVTHYKDGQPNITRRTGFEYSGTTGILTAELIEPDSSSNQRFLRNQYSHDSAGNVTRKTVCDYANSGNCGSTPTSDPYGVYHVFRTSSTEYDVDKRYVTKTKNGYNQVTSEVLTRNELGQPTEVKDITGNLSELIYGTFGQDYYSKSANGSWSQQIVQECSDANISCPTVAIIRSEKTNADGSRSYSYADALGRVVKTSALGFDGSYDIIAETAFDTKGRIEYTTLPYKTGESIYKNITYYDALDRVTRQNYADGSNDYLYYDGYIASELAIKTRTKNAENQIKTDYKNAIGELVKTTDNNSKSLTYTYNSTGDLLEVYFDGVLQSEIRYTSQGRKSHMWDWDKGGQNNKHWRYTYNPLGELAYQRDPKNQQIRIYRDRSGRKIRQLDRDVDLAYVADFRWTYNNSTTISNSIGQLTLQRDVKDSDLKVEPEYDSLGRNDVTTTTIAGKTFVSDTVFDSIGRVQKSFDPSGADHGLRYDYNAQGYLEEIVETKVNDGTIYRQITDMDNFGNVTREVFGNGTITTRGYEETTGRLLRINTFDGATARQNLEYEWDSLGRLTSRESISKGKKDTYTYDNLNRVKNVNGINQVNYDAKGNITWKKNIGNYTYGGTCDGVVAGSHAVSKIGTKNYCYDLNGNMLSGDGRTMEYSMFDKATSIEKSNHKTEFAYSPTRSRYKRTDISGSDITTTFYLGGVEYIQRPNGQTFYRRSIPGAVIEVPATGSMKVNYLHVDHLGSTDVITNSTGAIAQEYSFDFFGQKRNVTDWSTILTNTKFSPLDLTSKSYTGHESADEVGVIHMNGRIYDPKIGRFMQADPQIDGATDSQGYNRYTYVRNNPLAYTDPTGFRRSGGLKNFGRIHRAASYGFGGSFGLAGLAIAHAYNNNTKVQGAVNLIITVVGTYFCPPCAPGIAAGVASHSSAVNGGNAVDSAKAGGRAYVTTYISMKVSGAIGSNFKACMPNCVVQSALTHGALGGVMNVLNGGKFGHGFASSFLSKYIGVKANLMENVSSRFTRTMIAGIIGGTVSAATGGKFANGAAQSAIQWAFNAESGGKEQCGRTARQCHFRNLPQETQQQVRDAADVAFGVITAPIPIARAPGWMAKFGNWVKGVFRGGSTTVSQTVKLTSQQQKSIRSLETQISKHQDKLQIFKSNPTVRPGMENLSKELIQQQQLRRINHLETEINTFKNNINKINRGLD